MRRQTFLNLMAWMALALVYLGYAAYLAHMYATTGGHW